MSTALPPDPATVHLVVGQVLESVAFTEAIPLAEGFSAWQDPALCWAEVEMIAPHADHLILALPRSLASQLADDAWGGLDPAAADSAVRDFLGEFGNVIAGQLLARLNPGMEVVLGLPATGQGARTPPAGRHFTFDVDGHPLCITLKSAA